MSAAADTQASPIRIPRAETVASPYRPRKQTNTTRRYASARLIRFAWLFAVGAGSATMGCQRPVVFRGLAPEAASREPLASSVPKSEVIALIRHHARAAVAASTAGQRGQARAHWEAQRSLQAAIDGGPIDPGVDPKALASLTALLASPEVEPAVQKGTARTTATATAATTEPNSPAAAVSPAVGSPAWLKARVREILVEFGEDREVALPATFVQDVRRAVDGFTKGPRQLGFVQALHRMDKYLPTIHGIFSARRLPESFYYLALVESAFDPDARSRAGAVGLWQFMPATARHYGLTVRRGRDERRDPIKSTRAAREYLLDLILEFGDGHSMLLAIAAYNAGAGRVRNRLRKLSDYRDRSFWALAERKLLPLETRRFVPTVIAAAIVGRNRRHFRLGAPGPSGPVATVELRRPLSILYLLRASKLPESSLLALNPDLEPAAGVTPAGAPYRLVLPAAVAKRLESDPVLRRVRRSPSEGPTAGRRLAYRVRAGDTWWGIARWAGVTQAKLRRDNPRAARAGLRPGQLVYVHGAPDTLRQVYHAVAPGETLAQIAARYGVDEADLQQWNGLRRKAGARGQRLVVYTTRPLPSGPALPAAR